MAGICEKLIIGVCGSLLFSAVGDIN